MVSGFKRKASEEAASPDSGQQIIKKKARTDSPVKEVGDSTQSLRLFVLISTPHRKMVSLKSLHSALFHSLRRYPPILRHRFSCLSMGNG